MKWALPIVLALLLAAPALAAERTWRISGALSGDYALSYSRPTSPACAPDTVSEAASGVRLTLRSRLVYDTEERSVLSVRPVVLRFVGGGATFAGQVSPPNLDTCATQVYSCSGRVAGEGGRTRYTARLNLFAGTRGLIEDSTLVSVYGAGSGPEGTPCSEVATTGARGAFGPRANEVLAGALRLPRAKLAGRRAFTVTAKPFDRDDPCDQDFIAGCTERSTLALKLRFSRG